MQFHIARACHAMIWFVIPLSTSPHRPLSQLQLNYISCGWFHLSRSRWFLSCAALRHVWTKNFHSPNTEKKAAELNLIYFSSTNLFCSIQLRLRTDGRHTVNYCYTISLFNQPWKFEAERVEQGRGKANIIKLSQGSSRPFSFEKRKRIKSRFPFTRTRHSPSQYCKRERITMVKKSSYSLCRWLSPTFPAIVGVFERSEGARFSQLYAMKICWQCMDGVSERTGRKKALLYCSQSVIINLF